jgi:large subunit ribosomal protein L10
LDRGRKQAQVDELRSTFAASGAVIVAHYSGLSVADMGVLRREMRGVGASFKVTKNTLARIALDGTPFASIQSMFTGPTGIAFASDPVAAAKAVVAYANKNEKFKIIGGGLGTTAMDADGVKALAKMPPIEELRGRLLGVIVAPATQLVRILPAPATNVVGVLSAGAAKLVRVLHAYAAKQA